MKKRMKMRSLHRTVVRMESQGLESSQLQLKEEWGELQKNYDGVMQKTPPGKTKLAEHTIKTGDSQPVRLPPHSFPQVFRKTVEEEIQEMLSQGIKKPLSSECCSSNHYYPRAQASRVM